MDRATTPAMRRLAMFPLVGLLPLVACASASKQDRSSEMTRPAAPSPLIADATRGVHHAELAALLRDHWEWLMSSAPTWATTLGDHRYNDRLSPNSLADLEAA